MSKLIPLVAGIITIITMVVSEILDISRLHWLLLIASIWLAATNPFKDKENRPHGYSIIEVPKVKKEDKPQKDLDCNLLFELSRLRRDWVLFINMLLEITVAAGFLFGVDKGSFYKQINAQYLPMLICFITQYLLFITLSSVYNEVYKRDATTKNLKQHKLNFHKLCGTAYIVMTAILNMIACNAWTQNGKTLTYIDSMCFALGKTPMLVIIGLYALPIAITFLGIALQSNSIR